MTYLLKDPDAVLDYAVNWGAEYLGDDQLATSEWSVEPVEAGGVTVERAAKPGAAVLDKQQAQTLLLTPLGRYMDVPAPAGWFPLPVFWYTADMF